MRAEYRISRSPWVGLLYRIRGEDADCIMLPRSANGSKGPDSWGPTTVETARADSDEVSEAEARRRCPEGFKGE